VAERPESIEILKRRLAEAEHALSLLERRLSDQDAAEKRAEKAIRELRASEERYRSLVDNLGDIVYATDAEGRFTYVSSAAARFGFAPEDVIGKAIFEFVHPEDAAILFASWADALSGKPVSFTARMIDGAGKVRFVRVTGRAILDDGVVVGSEGVMADLTHQHETEEQLRSVQKMEAIGRLAGGVAHDFNNLLLVIGAYTDLAAEELPVDSAALVDLDEVRKATGRATALTRQLLAFSRKQVLRPEVLDVNALLAGLQKVLARLLGEDVELLFSPAPRLGATKADVGQIEQVLLNLAINARDAMPSGGRLRIETRNAEIDAQLASRHVGLEPGSYVQIAVEDNGAGMDEATAARVFEPFFSTKPAGKGTGLGLAMAYGIVNQSGGHITVHSRIGQGTRFDIFLPRTSDTPSGELRALASRKPRTGRETILLVEDEEAVRKLTQRMLIAAGYTVLTASNGPEALQRCAEARAEIKLLLTDVVMPGMNGRELADRLRNLCPHIRVLYMSGYSHDVIAERGAVAPDTRLVEKPFSSEALLRHVRDVLDGR
jgi:two-component system cell cycle sensor histidine kinase/response regulator CckA